MALGGPQYSEPQKVEEIRLWCRQTRKGLRDAIDNYHEGCLAGLDPIEVGPEPVAEAVRDAANYVADLGNFDLAKQLTAAALDGVGHEDALSLLMQVEEWCVGAVTVEAEQKIAELGGHHAPVDRSDPLSTFLSQEFANELIANLVLKAVGRLRQPVESVDEGGLEKLAEAIRLAEEEFREACSLRRREHDAKHEVVTCATYLVIALSHVVTDEGLLKEFQGKVVEAIVAHEEIHGHTDWQDHRLLGDLFRLSATAVKARDEAVEKILDEVIQL